MTGQVVWNTQPIKRERLARVVHRSRDQDETPKPEGRNYALERLKEMMKKEAVRDGQWAVHKLDGHSSYDLGGDTGREARKPSVDKWLYDVLNKLREKLEIEDEREKDKDRDIDHDPGLSH